jgi:hypothetical protein
LTTAAVSAQAPGEPVPVGLGEGLGAGLGEPVGLGDPPPGLLL